MPLSTSDIIFVLSGGTNNDDPTKSLGDNPSTHTIVSGMDNLFNDLTNAQTSSGYTDYRCFYIFNNNASANFFNTSIWIDSVVVGSGSIFLGINLDNEVQQIVVSGNITGGSLPINYESNIVSWHWAPSLSQWALNLQNTLNSITNPALTGVVVTVSQLGLNTTFQVQFAGNDSNRYQPLLANGSIGSLTGCTAVSITKISNGSPINSIAQSIDVATTPPFGINFTQPSFSSPIVLGGLRATDGFPVWVQRVIPAGAGAVPSAGFVIRYEGSPIS